jgi:hypothetical protein
VGEFMFQDDEDDEYNDYIKTLKQNETDGKKNFKEEVKNFFGKASIFSKKVSF